VTACLIVFICIFHFSNFVVQNYYGLSGIKALGLSKDKNYYSGGAHRYVGITLSNEEHHPMEPSSILPLSPEWRYRPYDLAAFVLQPGIARSLCNLRKHGYVLWGGITFNNPLLDCTVELESGTELYSNTFNATALIFAGLIAPTISGWWVSRNDPINGVYSAAFTPNFPGWAFYRRLSISLQNNVAVPIQVFRASLLCIEFLEYKV
jgi:hypothetical protein